MEEEEKRKKRPLDLDWDELLSKEDNEPQTILIIKTEPPKPSPMSIDQLEKEGYGHLRDCELEDRIRRQTNNVERYGPTLPDRGEKLRSEIKRLEEERERRKLQRAEMDADGCEKPIQSTNSSIVGGTDGFRQETIPSEVLSQSSFSAHFTKRMEENTNCSVVNAFDKELSILGPSERWKSTSNGEVSQRGRHKSWSSSKQWPFRCSRTPRNGEKHVLLDADNKGRASSTYSLHDTGENSPSCFTKKKDAIQVLQSKDLRSGKGQTVVLLDEEEPQLVKIIEPVENLPECMKATPIYYPSRNDPESVEICYMDIDCLAPEAYLTSPIMNFYIRYLQRQASPTNKAICDYHFFNTYFYKKLKEALSYKGSNKDAFFVKFRRWWKGVNIFHKAYVLIPIHEDLHWSLVIICIPDKEDESGPIILHLDSLGLHSSRSVFENIRSYLREEWNYLNQEVAPSDLPIADRIWKHLPRRIDENIIAVPQQKNDYDCGLFVLFFMQRFIEEAPERLKKKDLEMFGKQWFKPEEASGLRVKIRNLLIKEFKIANEA